jgi:anti-sigma-K factor RskA
MSEPDDIEAAAGEYVLGTLTPAERAEVALRRQSDAALDRAIRRWERDFAPLAEAGPSMAPPPGLLARIETRLDREGSAAPRPSGENVVALRRRVGWWRSMAIASSALAASLLLVIVWQNLFRPAEETRLVAVLQSDSTKPAFLVTVDLPERRLTVKPLTGPAAQDKSYELWLINAKFEEPRSLGVISAPLTVSERLRGFDSGTIEGSAVAVSLEPKGGSPTGKVTGPVLYSGPLISAPF